jgi:hypothetical protein
VRQPARGRSRNTSATRPWPSKHGHLFLELHTHVDTFDSSNILPLAVAACKRHHRKEKKDLMTGRQRSATLKSPRAPRDKNVRDASTLTITTTTTKFPRTHLSISNTNTTSYNQHAKKPRTASRTPKQSAFHTWHADNLPRECIAALHRLTRPSSHLYRHSRPAPYLTLTTNNPI